jgi:proteic killer suppression protein
MYISWEMNYKYYTVCEINHKFAKSLPFFGNFIYFCMEIEYSSNRLKKQLSCASEIKKAFGVNAKRVSARMADIISSPNLSILMQIPAANCHPLKGNKNGEWALDISGNHRMIFEIANDPVPLKDDRSIDTVKVTEIRIIKTTDYH